MRQLILCSLLCFNLFGAKPEADWTFLVFLNGNNDLDEFGALNINQMESVGSTERMNVVVQWASEKAATTKRLFITKDFSPTEVMSPTIAELPRVDMGDPKSLVDFAKWTIARYPAKHYFLVVWDHGSGWHTDTLTLKPWAISHDIFSNKSISTAQLGAAMREIATHLGRKIDIYASDACLMAMAEIASEMSDSVHYYLGSEENEPGEGWPYEAILKAWNAEAKMDAVTLGRILAHEYVASIKAIPEGGEATFSGFDLSFQSSLEREFASFAENLRESIQSSAGRRAEVKTVLSQTVSFDSNDYKDLGDFLTRIQTIDDLAEQAKRVESVLSSYIFTNETTAGFSGAKGAAVWMPMDANVLEQYMKEYRTLNFSRNTHWELSLEELYRK